MFKTGDRVRYIGKAGRLYGKEWTVKTSRMARQFRGGGCCTFYENLNITAAWANLKIIHPISLENK